MFAVRRYTVDAGRFDDRTRNWSQTGARRPVLGMLAGGAAGIVTLIDSAAKEKKKKVSSA